MNSVNAVSVAVCRDACRTSVPAQYMSVQLTPAGHHICRQVAAQANLIMLAGYETTAVALTQCIYFLCKHPEAQAKLLHEVDSVKGEINYEDLDKFPYAAAVLKEALRLHGPAPLFSRVAMKDTHVSHCSALYFGKCLYNVTSSACLTGGSTCCLAC